MKASGEVGDHIASALKERLEQEPDVVVAYLFGSVARGTAGPLSDVDVAVLLRPDATGAG
jgi:predicted nucleotidyltransferase